MAAPLTFKPVTKASWTDFETLFNAPGGPKYCWCMVWRRSPEEAHSIPGNQRKPLIKQRVDAGTTIGLLGYLDAVPVAWVSIAPRETYTRIGGREAKPEEEIWSLACMYIQRKFRGEGYGNDLIEAAADYARKHGATVLEAYPVDRTSPSYRFMGFVPAFERLGFTGVGREGSRRHIMRLKLN
jgi:GNAT superfamily N-acetyltransferase